MAAMQIEQKLGERKEEMVHIFMLLAIIWDQVCTEDTGLLHNLNAIL